MKNDPKKITLKKTEVKMTSVKKQSNMDDFIEKELKKFSVKPTESIKVDMNKIKLEKNEDIMRTTSTKFGVKINMSNIKNTEINNSQLNIHNMNESTKNTPFVINKGLNEVVEKDLLKKNIIEDLDRGSVYIIYNRRKRLRLNQIYKLTLKRIYQLQIKTFISYQISNMRVLLLIVVYYSRIIYQA